MVRRKKLRSFLNNMDELQHARFISELFRATLAEHPEYNTEELTKWVYDEYKINTELESEWSQYVLQGVDGIYLPEMLGYIKYRANKMLRLLGLEEIYLEHTENPMKWIAAYVDNFDGTKTDFFEERPRSYTIVSDVNGFDDL